MTRHGKALRRFESKGTFRSVRDFDELTVSAWVYGDHPSEKAYGLCQGGQVLQSTYEGPTKHATFVLMELTGYTTIKVTIIHQGM